MGFNKPSRIQGASLPIILGSNGVKYVLSIAVEEQNELTTY